ncbi:MAG: OmpA family protein [Candidatus Kapabacteria bacterium]|nr:OmpA family protein [Ignavibacteriota bacterium]MCW5885435.1 OmpA family protein [Candidatus Kapabacteria bacterium]
MKKFILLIMMLIISYSNVLVSNDLELTREFNLITSQNASGYLKPFFTSIGEGFNTSLYNTAYFSNGWSMGLSISIAGMMIPSSHRTYDAVLPDLYGNSGRVKTAQMIDGRLIENLSGTVSQPTLYGGRSHSIFAAPQNLFPPDSFYKSVGFLEGNDIGFMPALPIVQLYFGLPTRTEVRFRFLTFNMQDAPFNYFTIGVNQNIDKLLNINDSDDPLSFGITAAYHSMSRDRGIDISSLGLGLIASNQFADNISVYGGLMYENLSGNILMVRQDFSIDEYINSPYLEIRNGENLKINVETFNSFRITAGAHYDFSIFRLHGDISYAAQPVVNLGLSIKFFDHKEEKFKPIEYPLPDPDVKQERLLADMSFVNAYKPKTNYIAVIKEKVWDFDISLQMFALNDEIETKLDTIIIEEFESRQTRALLPYVFYEENMSEIPAKYHQISKDDSEKFSFGKMLGQSPLESYYDLLNVIGLRLRNKPEAKITLTGNNNNIGLEKNNTKLSRERAENIKNYFMQVWGISPERIAVEARNLPRVPSNNRDPDGQAENRRVEISSNDLDITAPVFIIDTLIRVNPPAIKYIPSAVAEAGLQSWSISSMSATREPLKKFSGGDKITDNLEWYLEGEGTKKRNLQNNLQTKFSAIDKQNNLRETVLNNPIKVISVKDKRLNATRDTSLNVYNLILFDFDKSTLSAVNKSITDFIKSELTPDTDVTILGFTDRIGDDKYNMRLSTARAESTGKALDGHPYKVIGMGETKLIYDNDLPEGRFYCRTVIVEAKVPIN